MDIKKEAEKLAKNINKSDIKKAADQALNSKVADDVIDKINDKTKNIDIKKQDVKNAINSVLK